MKTLFNINLILLIIINLYINLINGQCNRIVTRPEIRDLSPEQLRSFINAIQQLRNRGGMDVYEQLSGYHYNFAPNAHGVPAFFPWHREFLRRFELELQSIDPSIILPYWDWSIDSQSPERSIIFSNNYFGGNGSGNDKCLLSGPFGGWNVNVPDNHCLRRDFDNNSTISSFYSPEALELIFLQSTNYDQFRQIVEGNPHAIVHVGIGGEVGDLTNMFSSNDPLFFLHHTFIDKLWYEWQQRYPNLANTYNGMNNGAQVNSNDIMIPFNVPVSAAFDTTSDRYCYRYSRYSARLPNPPNTNQNQNNNQNSQNNNNQNIQNNNNQNNDIRNNPPRRNRNNNSRNNPNRNPSNNNNGRPGLLRNLNNSFRRPSRLFRRQLLSLSTDSDSSVVNLGVDLGLNVNIGSYSNYHDSFKDIPKRYVPSTDRSTRNKLRTCRQIPERYLKMNNLDVDKVRQFEKDINDILASFNSLEDFVPAVHLL